MSKSVFFVGLNYQQIKAISKDVANNLELFFLDINDMIAYNIKKEDAIQKVGVEYFNKQIKKIALEACDFENTIVNIPYDLYVQKDIYSKIMQNNKVVYIRVNQKQLKKQKDSNLDISLIVFKEIDAFLQKNSHLTIDYNNDFNQIINSVKMMVGE